MKMESDIKEKGEKGCCYESLTTCGEQSINSVFVHWEVCFVLFFFIGKTSF